MPESDLILLKLGGSLITDKNQPQTARHDIIARLANEISVARSANPAARLLIGHGSGSFGHVVARQYNTRQGVSTPAEWRGFADVARIANQLNRLVFDALWQANLPVHNFPPSAAVTTADGIITHYPLAPIINALDHGLIPLIHGDVAHDTVRGGTIVSTEDLFAHLIEQLRPARVLLAGIEHGVLTEFPGGALIPEITTANIAAVRAALGGAAAADVTGGMESKVLTMLAQVQAQPGLEIQIFTGSQPGYLLAALLGDPVPGTRIA